MTMLPIIVFLILAVLLIIYQIHAKHKPPLGLTIPIIFLSLVAVGVFCVELYRYNHPYNTYKCVVVTKHNPENPFRVLVKCPNNRIVNVKMSLEKWESIQDNDTITCKGWNENYLRYD